MRSQLISLSIAFLAISSPLSRASQQEEPAAPEESSEVSAESRPFAPTSIEDALDRDLDALREELLERPLDDVEELLRTWIGFVQLRQAELERDGWRADAGEAGPTHFELSVERDQLLEGVALLTQLVAERGGDAAAGSALIAEIRGAELERSNGIFVEQVDVERAREMPVEALKAYLRPLTAAQVEAQLEAWMALLRSECLVVRNAEIAALDTEDPERLADYNARAVHVRTARAHLIERVNVVVDSLESKGRDVTEARAYLQSVVERPKIKKVTALLTTAKAWLLSADGGLALLFNALKALGILVLAWLASKVLGRVAARAMRSLKNTSELLRDFVVVSTKRVTLGFGFLVALSFLGVDMGPLLAAIGAAGLVIGLALQGTLSNFASGLLIMTNRPFDVGDVVSTAGTEGHVRGMTLVTTRIETFDKRTVFVPNNMVWGDVLVNYTSSPTRRLDLMFGIGYADDQEEALKVLREVVEAHPKVLGDPAPVVRVHELADSSVNLVARPFVKNADYWDVYWDLTAAVKARFDRDGISIPFPQRDVHLIPVERDGAGDPAELKPAPPPAKTGSSTPA